MFKIHFFLLFLFLIGASLSGQEFKYSLGNEFEAKISGINEDYLGRNDKGHLVLFSEGINKRYFIKQLDSSFNNVKTIKINLRSANRVFVYLLMINNKLKLISYEINQIDGMKEVYCETINTKTFNLENDQKLLLKYKLNDREDILSVVVSNDKNKTLVYSLDRKRVTEQESYFCLLDSTCNIQYNYILNLKNDNEKHDLRQLFITNSGEVIILSINSKDTSDEEAVIKYSILNIDNNGNSVRQSNLELNCYFWNIKMIEVDKNSLILNAFYYVKGTFLLADEIGNYFLKYDVTKNEIIKSNQWVIDLEKPIALRYGLSFTDIKTQLRSDGNLYVVGEFQKNHNSNRLSSFETVFVLLWDLVGIKNGKKELKRFRLTQKGILI